MLVLEEAIDGRASDAESDSDIGSEGSLEGGSSDGDEDGESDGEASDLSGGDGDADGEAGAKVRSALGLPGPHCVETYDRNVSLASVLRAARCVYVLPAC